MKTVTRATGAALVVCALAAPVLAETARDWGKRALHIQANIDLDATFARSTWVGTHNSFANPEDDSLSDYNQPESLRDQLALGVRELVFDVHYGTDLKGEFALRLCHNNVGSVEQFCQDGITGNRKLLHGLDDIKAWIEEGNTDQVVLLKLELSDSARRNINKVEQKLDNHLSAYIYRPESRGDHGNLDTSDQLGCTRLPVQSLTRRAVLNAGKNVVIFTSHTCISDGGFNDLVFYADEGVPPGKDPATLAARTDHDTMMYRQKDASTNKSILGKGDASIMQPTVGAWLDAGLNVFEMYGFSAEGSLWRQQTGTQANGLPTHANPVQPQDMVWSWATMRPDTAGSNSNDCAMAEASGRLRDTPCTEVRAFACYSDLQRNATGNGWSLAPRSDRWDQGFAACGDAAQGSRFWLPYSAVERNRLVQVMQAAGATAVWVNYTDQLVEGEWMPNSSHPGYITERQWSSISNVGGDEGTPFSDWRLLMEDLYRDKRRLVKVEIAANKNVDKLRFTYSDGTSFSHGSNDPNESLTLGADEYLVKGKICIGRKKGEKQVDYVRFTTNTGRTVSGGKTKDTDCSEHSMAGQELLALRGRADSKLYALSFFFRRR